MRLVSPFISVLLISILAVGPLSAQTAAPSSDNPLIQSLQLHVIEGDGSASTAGSQGRDFVVEVTDANGAAVSDAAVSFRLPDVPPSGTFADGSHAAVAYTDQNGRARISGIQWGLTPGRVPVRVTATKGMAHAGLLAQEFVTQQAVSASTVPVPASPALPVASVQPLPLALPALEAQAMPRPPAPGQSATVITAAAPSRPAAPAQVSEPSVSVTSAPGDAKHHSGKKWLILLAVAGAAGAGVAVAGKKKSSSPPAPSTGLSIGTPTISVGHP